MYVKFEINIKINIEINIELIRIHNKDSVLSLYLPLFKIINIYIYICVFYILY